MALVAGLTVSRADMIRSTVVLPPISGAYTLRGAVCVSGLNRCAENAFVSPFVAAPGRMATLNDSILVDPPGIASGCRQVRAKTHSVTRIKEMASRSKPSLNI